MKKKLFIGAFLPLLLLSQPVFASSDLGLSLSNSSSSKSFRLKFGTSITDFQKISLSYSKSDLDPNSYSDTSADSLKLNYRLKWNPVFNTSFDLKKNNDGYFFEGYSGAIQVGLKIFSFDVPLEVINDSEIETLDTNIKVKFESYFKRYSKINNENYKTNQIQISVDQDLPWNISFNLFTTFSKFNSESSLMSRALNKQATANSDINSSIQALTSSSFGLGLDYMDRSILTGVSWSQDTPLYSAIGAYDSYDIYVGYEFENHLSLQLSYSVGRSSDTGSTSTHSTSMDLGYSW